MSRPLSGGDIKIQEFDSEQYIQIFMSRTDKDNFILYFYRKCTSTISTNNISYRSRNLERNEKKCIHGIVMGSTGYR
jgi:hypothetical protein